MAKLVKLSRRNLLTLLAKLNRVKDGSFSTCTIIKPDGTVLMAQEDEEHYTGRTPGAVLPQDEESLEETNARADEEYKKAWEN